MTFAGVLRLLGLAFVLVYTLSNVTLLQAVTPLYFLKHLSLVGLAGVGAVWWLADGRTTVVGRYVLFFSAVCVLAAPYALRFLLVRDPAEAVVFLQYLIFGVAVIGLSSALEETGQRTVPRICFLIMTLIALVAVSSAIIQPYLIYNTYYGRPRLLLGFWHPKELGVLVGTVAFLVLTRAILRIRPIVNGSAYMCLLVLLALVDSRNMFLFAVLFGLAYFVSAYAGYVVLWSGLVASGVAAVWFVASYPLLADILTSRRLTVWTSIEYPMLGQGTSIGGGGVFSKFHIDNYYLEYVAENGIYAGVLLLLMGLILTYAVLHTRDRRWRRLKVSAAIAFFVVCIFDSGMFSTGNLLNLALWVYILGGERIAGGASTPTEAASTPSPAVVAGGGRHGQLQMGGVI
jgi:hypothetical protein